jgi:hypothetical protein
VHRCAGLARRIVDGLDLEAVAGEAGAVAVGVGEPDGGGQVDGLDVFAGGPVRIGVIDRVQQREGELVVDLAVEQAGRNRIRRSPESTTPSWSRSMKPTRLPDWKP